MRRLIDGTAAYFADLGRATARGWDTFLFRPSDPTPVGLIRLGLGLLLLWDFAILGMDLHAFLGSTGWADPEALAFFRLGEQDRWSWSLWSFVPDSLLLPAYLTCLVVLLAFTVGLWSRWTAVLAWVILVSTVRRVPVAVFGFDQAASMIALYLAATGASGRAVSVDRFLERFKGTRREVQRGSSVRPFDGPVGDGRPPASVAANLCLRLIQVHLCIIYGLAGLAKLQHPIWWEGWALGSLLGYSEFRPLDLTWLARWPMLLMLLSHGALWLEVLYPVLVWVVKMRPLVVASAVALHLGIAVTMGLYEFAAAMIVANLAFVSGPWLRSLATGTDPEPLRVLYDGACGICRNSAAVAAASDPSKTVEWLDVTGIDVKTIHESLDQDKAIESIYAVGPGDRVRSGFATVVAVARRVPILWPLGLIGGLPGINAAGQAAYEFVSKHRSRDPARANGPKGQARSAEPDPAPRNRPPSPRARR